jgi:hypothetical protein
MQNRYFKEKFVIFAGHLASSNRKRVITGEKMILLGKLW